MKRHKRYDTLRLILGDQLNEQHTWFSTTDNTRLYVIAELKQEATYVKHHIQKLCTFFSAMEIFATTMMAKGHHVLHMNLDATTQYDSLGELLVSLFEQYDIKKFEFQRPDEYRLRQQLFKLKKLSHIEAVEYDSEHFLLPFNEIQNYIQPGQHNRMEAFYRKMRKRFKVLMNGDNPLGGQWNFDSENRQKLKSKDLKNIPQPLLFSNNISTYLERIRKHKIPYIGQHDDTLLWPISREQSLALLDFFCEHCLPLFGRFQDAMICEHPSQWSLYHSRLSFSLNSKMLHPWDVISRAVESYEKSGGVIDLAQVEGFVRQILGWREYVRAVYWSNMPDYQQQNYLHATRKLPAFFWTADTQMLCMRNAISQSLTHAYAHHIQRLMITGNFCLLTGIHPEEVDAWYLGIYIDAIEWVELPNTRGMSQFADGGWVATKPYCASANYVNKMSDYCQRCSYDHKEKYGENACPLNSLYWYFMNEHRETLSVNPRIAMLFRAWDKQEAEAQQATLQRARWCLENIETL